ncbi:hypothetical protein EAH84_02735 [Sphingomonas oligophenolica]|uniref:Uncharacterized protein n=1 Tax=Sphingomonas oligophenolica TaxID=301154 RepID=A0A502CKR8_9SPHN|nr:hypothetical protein EAH84_02735 [Sphingomonas oligophenolica]
MVAVMNILIFSGALTAAIGVMSTTLVPQWRRVLSLAAGNIEEQFAPLGQLAIAERRIAVRRWASESVPVPLARLRAAA